jgi:hypothetical protein
VDAGQAGRAALWEAEMARRALAPLGVPVILLKGTAYAAAGLPAAEGRSIGDLDILARREDLPAVEQALLGAGWEWVKEDAYDDLYYRQWMHELPPLIHRERDRMIDVHHTILPLTARPKPNAASLIENSVSLDSGLRILSPAHMIVHAAAHLFADGDLAGGLRNLWDIDRLLREFSRADDNFVLCLVEEACSHGLGPTVMTALRLSRQIFGTPLDSYVSPALIRYEPRPFDRLIRDRLLARNGWGQGTRPVLRLAYYVTEPFVAATTTRSIALAVAAPLPAPIARDPQPDCDAAQDQGGDQGVGEEKTRLHQRTSELVDRLSKRDWRSALPLAICVE